MKNNERIIEGLDLIIKGASIIREELSGTDTAEAPVSKSVSRRTKVQKEEPVMNEPEETIESAETVAVKFSKEQLDSMKYNELKKLGASLGVPCTGKRDEITARILALDVEATVEPVEEEDEGKVVSMDKAKKGLKKTKKEEKPEVSEEFIQKAKEIAEETDVEDIVEALADVGIKAEGKKSDVVMLLAKALEDGLIDVDDEEEETAEAEETPVEEESSEEAETEEEGEEFTAQSYFEEYDPDGANNPDNMTEERKEAVEALMTSIIEGVENEEITEEDISTFCESYCTEEELEALGEEYEFEDLVALYCETRKRLIDDEGEEHEAGDPYEIAEENYCCGHKLKYEKKSKKFICEVCGEEYEAE